MEEYCIRLIKGDDLKKRIEEITVKEKIDTAIVLSAVGSISKLHLRLATAKDCLEIEEDFEIVSLIGTISNGKTHLHISAADKLGNVIGGHLKDGTIINTTCELVLGIIEEYDSFREYDLATGYNEIVFRKKD